jgi:CHAT domain-containing protein
MQATIKKWETDYAQNADSILWLTSEGNAIEKRLANRCRRYGNIAEFMNVGYEEIKTALGDENVLIDFTDFVSESRGRVYAAYFVNKQQKYPLLQELFQESVIDSMQVANPDMYYDYPYAEKIYELIWKPFAGKVCEGATIYYVPSQLLFQMAIESIPMPDGSLLCEHYNFVRLSSAREIVRIKQQIDLAKNKGRENAILYGGLQYDLEPKDMVEEAAKYEVAPLLATRGDMVRGDSIYRELPETKKEVEAIERTLKKQQLSVKPYYGMSGTEESFLSMSGKAPQILHVATHGFYYTPEEAENYDYLRGYNDAMSLSGIVMAGGNAAWLGKELPKGVLGGILTAANIARLDLSGLELVVLSACQTGRGRATSEGLFGLQRAFKKAGAKTMVMTLWSVSDVVTKEFMIKFYENLADNNSNWNKRKAFDDAKSYIRSKYEDPYYWAGFVMLD